MDLEKCYYLLEQTQSLNISYKKYISMLENDLEIDTKDMDKKTKGLFAEVLVYYMKSWPDWPLVKENKKQGVESNFNKFKTYVKMKLHFVYNNKQNIINDIKNKPSRSIATQVTGDESINKRLPCTLNIYGRPVDLNNILFKKQGNDLVAAIHSKPKWNDELVSYVSLMNYPNVTVNVNLPDITFSRKIKLDYDNDVSIREFDPSRLKPGQFIDYITQNDSYKPVSVYKLFFFEKYIAQFRQILDSTDLVSANRKEEILTILYQFLHDVDEMDLHCKTMATNTSVCFNIGHKRYGRSKSTGNNKNDIVHYTEVITPKVTLSLKSFIAEQDCRKNDQNITFISLNKAINNLEQFVEPILHEDCITYVCNLCNTIFSSFQFVKHHFEVVHGPQIWLPCNFCAKQVPVLELCASRWIHSCILNREVDNSTASTSKQIVF